MHKKLIGKFVTARNSVKMESICWNDLSAFTIIHQPSSDIYKVIQANVATDEMAHNMTRSINTSAMLDMRSQ